jgi:wobble nucleotide-excising tRNase
VIGNAKDDKEKEKLSQEVKNLEKNIEDAKAVIDKANESVDSDLWEMNVVLSILESKIEKFNTLING